MSQDGRYVAFSADADALSAEADPDVSNVFRKDRVTGAVVFVSRATGAGGAAPARSGSDVTISDDGGRVAWITEASLDPADADANEDVYVRDIATDTTILASPGTADDVEGYDLSGDGAFVALATTEALAGAADANGVLDVYRRRLADGATALASRQAGAALAGNGASRDPSISDDGRWIAFTSAATNLVAGYVAGAGGDVFARDMTAAVGYLVSNKAGAATTGANGSSRDPRIAGAPAAAAEVFIAYNSNATDLSLVAEDTSDVESVYRRRLGGIAASGLVSRADGVLGANADSRAHVGGISDSGALVTFASDAQNLTPAPDYYGVYTRDVGAGTTVLDVGRHAVRRRAVDRGRRIACRLDQRRRRHHTRQRSRPDGRVRARLPRGAARIRLAPAGLGAVPGAGGEHRGRRHGRPHDQRRRPLRRLHRLLVAPAGYRGRRPDLPARHAHRSDRAGVARERRRRGPGRQHERGAVDQRRRDARGVHLLRAPGSRGHRRRRAGLPARPRRGDDDARLARRRGRRRAAGQRRDRRAHQRRRAARDVPQRGHEPRRGRRRDRPRLPARRGGGNDAPRGPRHRRGRGDRERRGVQLIAVRRRQARRLHDPRQQPRPGRPRAGDPHGRLRARHGRGDDHARLAAERARRRQGDGLIERRGHQRGRPHGRVRGRRRAARDRGRAVGRHGPGGRARAGERAEHAREPRARRRGRGCGRIDTRASAATAR